MTTKTTKDAIKADRARSAATSSPQRFAIGQRVLDKLTGRRGAVAGNYGARGTYSVNLDIVANTVRKPADTVDRLPSQLERV